MNILVTLDSNYINQLMVMLKSVEYSNASTRIVVYIIHTKLTEFDIAKLKRNFPMMIFKPIVPNDEIFNTAHFTKRITKETYYRLLLCEYLPAEVDRILYLDPDTVVIKSLKHLYNFNFGDNCFIGAGHTDGVIEKFNKKRLKMGSDSTYINAGVLMINVNNLRKIYDIKEIKKVIKQKGKLLYQADQDVINTLYWTKTYYVSPLLYNLDERTYKKYKLSLDDVINHTVIIHYDGKNKPWNDNYDGLLDFFYNNYERLLIKNDKKIQLSTAD